MLKINNLRLLILVTVFLCILTYISNYLLNPKELLLNFYSKNLIQEQVEKIIYTQKKWSWLSYIIIPILVLIRSNLVALCLNLGVFFYDTENDLKFKQFLKIALVGELVLIFIGVFKFCHFYFIQTDYNLEDLQRYFPLSYINFLDINKIDPWLIYPLQTINLFEITYFFVLAFGLYKLLQNKFWKSFEIVAISYGTGLVIWIGLVMFLTLNYT